MKYKGPSISLLAILLLTLSLTTIAQTSAFTYQGKLTDAGVPLNGQYDLVFKIYDTDTSPTPVATQVIVDNVPVTNGLFSVELSFDFPPFTTISANWIEIGMRPGTSTGAFTTLTPRQHLTSAPYAMQSAYSVFSNIAQTAQTANNVSGVVGVANGGTGSSTKNFVDLSTDQTVAGNKTFTGNISGNGAGITNLNGANITSGTVTESSLAPEILNSADRNARLLGSLRWDQIRVPRTFGVGSFPVNAAFDGTNMWVVNNSGGTVMKVRPSDGVVLNTYSVAFAYGIVFDGANMWVTNRNLGTITKLRASDGANLGTFTVGGEPIAAAFDGTNIWVANNTTNNVTRLRAIDGANLGTTTVGTNPFAIAFDGNDMWVSCFNGGGSLYKLLGSSGAVSTSIVIPSASGLAFDGEYMWVAGGSNVYKVRTTNLGIVGTFAASGPLGLAFDGTNIWAVNGGGTSSVTVYRASDGEAIRTIRVGSFPLGVAFDGANIWVVNQLGNSVTRIGTVFR